ncbi:MAG: hypothetical protein JST92_05370 [Deltaproteobacteria bacterium]|nr:hypothetical protein [Deltaproteobacteria bacterium]
MGKLVVFLLALALLAFTVKWTLERDTRPGEATAQKKQLDNVREKKVEIERNEEQRLKDTLDKTAHE